MIQFRSAHLRIYVLLGLLAVMAIGLTLLVRASLVPLDSFSDTRGPRTLSVIPEASTSDTDWRGYAEGGKARLAIFLTDDTSSWRGIAFGLQAIGVPFTITDEVSTATEHNVILAYPALSGRLLDAEESQALKTHVLSGGTLIATQVLGGGFGKLFGFEEVEETRSHAEISFTDSDPTLRFIDHPHERTVRIGNPDRPESLIGTQVFHNPLNVLAQYEDGGAAVIGNSTPEGGHAYALGFDLGFFILKAQNDRDDAASRLYANGYEPSVDVWLRWLKTIYQQQEPNAVTIWPVPQGKAMSIIYTFDVDYAHSIENMSAYSDILQRNNTRGTFFLQTKYFHDYNDVGFFNDHTLAEVQQLAVQGMEIASHSVSHSLNFSDMPLGSGAEMYPEYQPRVTSADRTQKGTIFGELRVSKYLLETVSDVQVTSFRPGYLATPDVLPQAAEASGYKYVSSVTAANVLTYLPYRTMHDRMYDYPTGVFQFPIAIEDEIPPAMEQRLGDAFALVDELSDYGALFIILIHPNELDEKLDVLSRTLQDTSAEVWSGTLSEYGDWWTMRDRMRVDVTPYQEGVRLHVRADQPIRNVCLDVDPQWQLTNPPAATSYSEGRLCLVSARPEAVFDFTVSRDAGARPSASR